ncbi:EAL domain-containing protein [Pseudidiomarina planktonica]|uniref:EAL domain-containing protein n=1 Tax=Pseudidiomarina planktonica TaxID=1323738 RepID=UPI0013564030|nr:EAL domain-containing protein [Pseudidiomarina planktonica]
MPNYKHCRSNQANRAFLCFGSYFVALLLLLAPISAIAQSDPQLLRVGVYHNPPKLLLSDEGQPGGILGELLQHIAEQENWRLEVTPCTWDQCLELLDSGQIDIMPDVAYSESRNQRFNFHKTPALLSWSQLYHHGRTPLVSLLDLKDKRIAVLSSSIQQEYLHNMVQSFDLSVNWYPVDTMAEGFSAVLDGRADAVAADHFYGNVQAYKQGLYASPIMFQPAKIYYATADFRHGGTLQIIDDYLNHWQGDHNSVYHQIIRKWSLPEQTALLPGWVQWSVFALAIALVIALSLNLLLRRQIDEKTRYLKASEKRLNTILNSVEAFIYIKGNDLTYQYANRKTCELLGVTAEELVGKSDRDFFDEQTAQMIERNDRLVVDEGKRLSEEEINVLAKTGEKRVFLSVKIPLRDGNNNNYALCGISTDITEHQQIQDELHHLAFYDSLTGLANRRQLLEHMKHALASGERTGFEGAVLMIDLDGFKVFNDTVGHEQGDRLLQKVSQRISSSLRSTDTAGRLGADDFMVILEDLSPDYEQAIIDARDFAMNLLRDLAQPYQLDTLTHVTSATIGITMFSDTKTNVEGLLKSADLALADAKASGRGTMRFFNPRMQQRISRRIHIESALREALESDQLELHLQPQVTQQGKVIGMEALLRWHDADLGQMSPGEFIPIAESSGLIIPLGEWVLQRACSLLSEWQQLPHMKDLTLAVNISPKQFRHPKFVPHILHCIRQANILPEKLELEVTESMLIDDMAGTISRMNQLRERGIRFALDDFGTGYASLSHLKLLPLYQLKIDQSFVKEITTEKNDEAIVQTIIALGGSLGLEVLAEGVETEAQMEKLKALGVNHFQGYYFGYPQPADHWLQELENTQS